MYFITVVLERLYLIILGQTALFSYSTSSHVVTLSHMASDMAVTARVWRQCLHGRVGGDGHQPARSTITALSSRMSPIKIRFCRDY